MIIKDKVYGKNEIKDKLFIDLINSKAIQRMKGINQYGTYGLIYPHMDVSRFDHSIGVFLLLRRLGAYTEELVAGLIHDVCHTAFSHVIDYAFEKQEAQDFHEEFFEEVVQKSDIPLILKKHSINIDNVLDIESFTLLEQEIPNLCADRLDYFLRDALVTGMLEKNQVNSILHSIIVEDGKIMLNNDEIARLCTIKSMEMNKRFWASPIQSALYQTLGQAIKIGLDQNLLSKKDLFVDDNHIMQLLKKSDNKSIQSKLKLLHVKAKNIGTEKNYDYCIKGKARYIDPFVIIDKPKRKQNDDVPMRISELDIQLKDKINKFIEYYKKDQYIKVSI